MITLPHEKLIPIDVRKVSQKGGSLSLTIPIEIVKKLDLKPDDKVVFFFDEETKQIIIDKAVATFITPSGLSFSLSKEQIRKLFGKEPKNGTS